MSSSPADKASVAARCMVSLGLVLGAAHILSRWQARRAEARFPPAGKFIEVDGVRLHYIEHGEGPAVVLLHGQGAMLQHYTETILPKLAETHRVIAFDRPGSGYSSRPPDTRWTPERQAQLFHSALQRLGVHRPIILGHSCGALVAMAHGLAYPRNTSGLVLLSGFYYPVGRILLGVANLAAHPVIGPLLCNTLLPPLFRLAEPLTWRVLFKPHQVPVSTAEYPFELSARPDQLRTFALESGQLEPSARRMKGHYPSLHLPTALIAGKGDHVVSAEKHSVRLHRELPASTLRLLDNCGHMPHYTHPHVVLQAVAEVAARSSQRAGS